MDEDDYGKFRLERVKRKFIDCYAQNGNSGVHDIDKLFYYKEKKFRNETVFKNCTNKGTFEIFVALAASLKLKRVDTTMVPRERERDCVCVI